jgi:hypothetical protein
MRQYTVTVHIPPECYDTIPEKLFGHNVFATRIPSGAVADVLVPALSPADAQRRVLSVWSGGVIDIVDTY